MARIYDKTTDAFVEKENFAIQMSPLRTRDPEQPLHTEEFSITKNRLDLKIKNVMQEQQSRNMAASLSPGPKQKFYTRWESSIPEESEAYGARPSQR
jgi:hypothetical protein